MIAAGTRGDDPAFQAAEHEWQVRYEQLLTAVRGTAFRYLQAQRHEATVQAAVIEAGDADRDVPESAAQAFHDDAQARLRTDDTTPLLEATSTAYESAARPVVDQAHADIHAALHRPAGTSTTPPGNGSPANSMPVSGRPAPPRRSGPNVVVTPRRW